MKSRRGEPPLEDSEMDVVLETPEEGGFRSPDDI